VPAFSFKKNCFNFKNFRLNFKNFRLNFKNFRLNFKFSIEFFKNQLAAGRGGQQDHEDDAQLRRPHQDLEVQHHEGKA
jgi:hypothetical protein